MITYANCNVAFLSTHFIGNKANGETLQLSRQPLRAGDENLQELLRHFFLSAFEANEFFTFDFSQEDPSLNPVHHLVQNIFAGGEDFHEHTKALANFLFDQTNHPKIKPGELYVAYLTGLVLEDEVLDAVGLFKSETKQPFLQLRADDEEFQLDIATGTAIDKLDKGCLVFNTHAAEGYKICMVDKSNRAFEAQYWRDLFLKVKPLANDYYHTTHYMRMAKDFVVNKLDETFPVTKADKIDYLNRSVNYFKSNDTLVDEEFAKIVFEDEEVGNAFHQHRETYAQRHELPLEDSFQISAASVKKQERVLRSVLKLDKNFHIYIHGDRSMIERGFDDDRGKSYYKVYFEEEQ